jgi:hypothetical protein
LNWGRVAMEENEGRALCEEVMILFKTCVIEYIKDGGGCNQRARRVRWASELWILMTEVAGCDDKEFDVGQLLFPSASPPRNQ